MLFTFLLVVHAIIAAALVGVILVQRSEGGGLGMGGSPTGLMSARGAADFLTRATTVLATLFVLMSIGLAVLASVQRGPRTIDTSLARTPGAAAGLAPALPVAGAGTGNGVPLADPLAGGTVGNATAPELAPAPAAAAGTRRQRGDRAASGNETSGTTENGVAPAAKPESNETAAPRPEPASSSEAAPVANSPAPPANSSPGTTNANGATPPSQ